LLDIVTLLTKGETSAISVGFTIEELEYGEPNLDGGSVPPAHMGAPSPGIPTGIPSPSAYAAPGTYSSPPRAAPPRPGLVSPVEGRGRGAGRGRGRGRGRGMGGAGTSKSNIYHSR